jgi:hypothetical protein
MERLLVNLLFINFTLDSFTNTLVLIDLIHQSLNQFFRTFKFWTISEVLVGPGCGERLGSRHDSGRKGGILEL